MRLPRSLMRREPDDRTEEERLKDIVAGLRLELLKAGADRDKARQRVRQLEGQLDTVANAGRDALRIATHHAEVRALPPLRSQDRANCHKLSDRLAAAQAEIGEWEKRAYTAEAALDKLLADTSHADDLHALERTEWAAERQHLMDRIDTLKGDLS